MKEYVLLYRTVGESYHAIEGQIINSLSQLEYLLAYDFRPWDTKFLNRVINWYNSSFIYHNFEKNMLYMGFGLWLVDEDVESPSDKDFPEYVKTIPHCRMSLDNYLEFRDTWVAMKKTGVSFALLYRDDNDWVYCKGFETKEVMELFVQEHSSL